tara:strand:- start:1859 stop:2020 length:162 start_codon:yes stop_codon:yes gene_type:complete
MYRKDQIKGIVALVLFGLIALSYWLFGKEIAKWVATGGFVVWLATMYFLNRGR